MAPPIFRRAFRAVVASVLCALACGCAAGVELPDKRPADFRVDMTASLRYSPAGTDHIRITPDAVEWERDQWATPAKRKLTLRFSPDLELLDEIYTAARRARLHTLWHDEHELPTAQDQLNVKVDGDGRHFEFEVNARRQVNDEPRLNIFADAIHDLGCLPARRPIKVRLTVDDSAWPLPDGAMLDAGLLREVTWAKPEAGKPLQVDLVVESDDWKSWLQLLVPAAGTTSLQPIAATTLKTDGMTHVIVTLKRSGDNWTFTQP